VTPYLHQDQRHWQNSATFGREVATNTGSPETTAACAPGAVSALCSGPAADAFRIGQHAIGLLDRHGQTVPLSLPRRTADAALTSG
jgi:hypothetical protein